MLVGVGWVGGVLLAVWAGAGRGSRVARWAVGWAVGGAR